MEGNQEKKLISQTYYVSSSNDAATMIVCAYKLFKLYRDS